MRITSILLAVAGVGLIGAGLIVANLSSGAGIDPSAAVRGSLGVSVDELTSNGSVLGGWTWIVNSGFALLVGALAIVVARSNKAEDPSLRTGNASDTRRGATRSGRSDAPGVSVIRRSSTVV